MNKTIDIGKYIAIKNRIESAKPIKIETPFYSWGGRIILYRMGEVITDRGHTAYRLSADFPKCKSNLDHNIIGEVTLEKGSFVINCPDLKDQDAKIITLCHVIMTVYVFYQGDKNY